LPVPSDSVTADVDPVALELRDVVIGRLVGLPEVALELDGPRSLGTRVAHLDRLGEPPIENARLLALATGEVEATDVLIELDAQRTALLDDAGGRLPLIAPG